MFHQKDKNFRFMFLICISIVQGVVLNDLSYFQWRVPAEILNIKKSYKHVFWFSRLDIMHMLSSINQLTNSH